jgi:DNA-binding protein YbaB
VNSSGFDGELARVRQELRDLAATTDGEPPEGYGEAAEGMIAVTAVNGRLSSVELNPRVLRMASEELAEAFAAAVNAALADMESKYRVPAYPSFDPGRLDAQLAEVEEQSARQMREYRQTIDDALRQLGS